MPALATLQAFAATVEANDHVGAITKFYAPDAATRENNSPPTVGRDVLAEKERRTLASVAGVTTTRLGPLFLDAAGTLSCWLSRHRWILRAPHAGCASRISKTAASISVALRVGDTCGRRERSRAQSFSSAVALASHL
jgi:hypothetical protein